MNCHIKRPVLENNLFMSLQFVIAQQPLADFQHVALTIKFICLFSYTNF